MNLANNVTAVSLTWLWYKPGKPWRCTLCAVDDEFMRVKPFTVEAPSAEEALALAKHEAEAYKFPVQVTAVIEGLNLEIDL
ncbi:MAG TPA: hypothetical protein VIM69_10525 [Opitutaceae bacterium]